MDNVKDDFYYSKRILSNIDACLKHLDGFDLGYVERNPMLCDALENRFTKLSEDCSKLSFGYKKKLSEVN